MNAEQARRISDEHEVSILNELYVKIEEAAKKGERRIYYFDHLTSTDKTKLVLEGYKLHENHPDLKDPRETYSVTISW